ncbi:hypothetical protein [Enterococcus faecalis]|uniref:AbiU2 domain-containing protein n=1 Tax=Enterococcus faecalis TaxID=1351 RepID=UPI003CC55939
MEKEQLIEKADIFMSQATQANCYNLILTQIREGRGTYSKEMSYSPAFYHYAYNALVVATFMELSKIYDSHRSSSNIEKFIQECKSEIAYFPKYHPDKKIEINGTTEILKIPFQHTITDDERDFFKDRFEYDTLFNTVEMTIEQIFDLYEWHLLRLKPQITNLLKQRNKVYAHNEEARMKHHPMDIIQEFSLNYQEIGNLINFALKYCNFVLATLTGINKAFQPSNISDLENSLTLIKIGEEYRETYIQNEIKKITDSEY